MKKTLILIMTILIAISITGCEATDTLFYVVNKAFDQIDVMVDGIINGSDEDYMAQTDAFFEEINSIFAAQGITSVEDAEKMLIKELEDMGIENAEEYLISDADIWSTQTNGANELIAKAFFESMQEDLKIEPYTDIYNNCPCNEEIYKSHIKYLEEHDFVMISTEYDDARGYYIAANNQDTEDENEYYYIEIEADKESKSMIITIQIKGEE